MGYAVFHMMKIKSGAVGGIQSHNNREHEPKTNPDVNMSRSEDKYDLIPCDNYQMSIQYNLSTIAVIRLSVNNNGDRVFRVLVHSPLPIRPDR
ncbi:plasmid recombination protein, partial [Clostridioides difficile]|uniref:plasmid recombination protein n=1 Tax=Clostridioides difficile TaxID=1496 RepID=UPI001596862C